MLEFINNNVMTCQVIYLFMGVPQVPIMIFLRSAGFFQQFREYVCPAFSAPGFRSGVLRTGDTLSDGLLSILF